MGILLSIIALVVCGMYVGVDCNRHGRVKCILCRSSDTQQPWSLDLGEVALHFGDV
ncbi:multifunctional fatty acid oxidation complex subunit alpha domain protein [Vibrio parahaemolyticus VP2007-095]|nr:multifunctional fatty acid oxidation complex subunit alpha domain protein [Vibrio parahaemolyticus VP2007-095]